MSKVSASGQTSKVEDTRVEDVGDKMQNDQVFNVMSAERVDLSDEQSRAVCRKIDKIILPVLVGTYFLQILDKTVVGYGAIFGMPRDAGLVGNQYSLVGSAGYWAQLAWQPFSAYVIVRVPHRILLPVVVFCWGFFTIGMGLSTSFNSLIACRFFLGLFEASCLPLFSVITSNWYRKSEQPIRIALWYGSNGVASMLGSLLAYGLSFGEGKFSLYVYQVLFLIVGILTVVWSPCIWWLLDNGPTEARFLTPEERLQAVERLRDNNGGAQSSAVQWNQVWETLWSPVSWAFVALQFAVNTGASVSSVFGPLIISGIGFSPRTSILLNIPFGFLQLVLIVFACVMAVNFKWKSPVLGVCCAICIVGTGLLYGLKGGAIRLLGYYLIAPLFAMNPVMVSWILANLSGTSKKATMMSLYNTGNAVGNLVGPLLFTADQKPLYRRGLLATLGIFCAAGACIVLLVFMFIFLNKRNERLRVSHGKPAKIHDRSMEKSYRSAAEEPEEDEEAAAKGGVRLGLNAFADISDFKNDEFVYSF